MADGAHITLDDPLLRSRLRREPTYIKRPVLRPQPTLLTDIRLRRRYQASLAQPSRVVDDKQPVETVAIVAPTAAQVPEIPVQVTSYPSKHISNSVPALSRQTSSKVLMRNVVARSGRKKHSIKNKSKLQLALILLAVGFVLAGGYFSLLGFRANHVVEVQAAKLTQQANQAAVSTKSGSTPAPAISTVKPSAAAVTNYVVAPNLPRYIIIKKLGVDARILSVGVNAEGALEPPNNVYDTAWYNESAEPGQSGAMLIDGHVSSWTAHGVFYGIKTLAPGDIITIQRGDGTLFNYSVVQSQVYPSGNVDMVSAMTPVDAGQPGLNLITCTGDVIPGTSEFNERIVVYATLTQ